MSSPFAHFPILCQESRNVPAVYVDILIEVIMYISLFCSLCFFHIFTVLFLLFSLSVSLSFLPALSLSPYSSLSLSLSLSPSPFPSPSLSLSLSPSLSAVCDFIVHRKCEARVNIDCSSKMERAVLQRDQLVEEHTAAEEEDSEKERKV